MVAHRSVYATIPTPFVSDIRVHHPAGPTPSSFFSMMKSNGTPFQHDPSICDRLGGGWWWGGFYRRGKEGIRATSDEKMGFWIFSFYHEKYLFNSIMNNTNAKW
jgi:hypothetical protein